MNKKPKFLFWVFTIAWCTFTCVTCVYSLDFPSYGKIKKDGVNVRADSTTHSRILGTLGQSNTITLIGEKYSWYRVILPSHFKCFVASQYLKKTQGDKGIVTISSLNIRHTPSLEANIIGRLPEGEEVSIEKIDNEWTQINCYPFAYGWVHKKFVECVPPGEIKETRLLEKKLIPQETPGGGEAKPVLERKQNETGIVSIEEKDEAPSSSALAKGTFKKIEVKKIKCPANYMLESEKGFILLKIKSESINLAPLLGKTVTVWGRVKIDSCVYIEATHIQRH